MYIPTKRIGKWARELVETCLSDQEERIQRGALYRNLYLTGDENGSPATYNKTYSYIDNLASFLFSPVELNYHIKFHGGGNATQREMGRTAASRMQEMMQTGSVYNVVADAVEWSLVKGKTFVKMSWEGDTYAAYLVQPEFMGVLRPDIPELSRQPAFVFCTYYMPDEFRAAFRWLDNIDEVMKKVSQRATRMGAEDRPDRQNAMKQIILGGLNPYQQASNSPATASSRGIVNWLAGPTMNFDPKVMANLVRLDELWVWDSTGDDWATFQLVGDVVVTGDKQIRNAFADMYDPDNPMRKLPQAFKRDNPLTKRHPFIEFCPNPLDNNFWGRSECCNIGVLQMQINARLNGIQRLLRRQERPPRLFTGSTALNRDKYSALDMPGGYFSDSNPNAKMQAMYPELPPALWESLHELEAMFDEMSGLPPVLKGRGEAGVRAGAHAETLTRNASPRFKARALLIEKSVADIGDLSLSLAQAKDDNTMVTWLDPDTQNEVAKMAPDEPELEAPAPGMRQFPFRFMHIPPTAKVVVDSHSSSPVFGHETRGLLFDLVKLGAMDATELLEHLHPPGEDELVADLQRKKIMQSQMLKSLPPEMQAKVLAGAKKK